MACSSWTGERVDRLRQLWADGYTSSQIAADLGGGVTRSAVIAKIHRMGCQELGGKRTRHGEGRSNGAAKPPRPKKRRQNMTFTQRGVSSPPGKALDEMARVEAERIAATPPSERLRLLDLTNEHCRFPIGDPQDEGFFFCGAKPKEGRVYCEFHTRLAFTGAPNPAARPFIQSRKSNG